MSFSVVSIKSDWMVMLSEWMVMVMTNGNDDNNKVGMTTVMEMAMVMCVCGHEWESCARASAHAHVRAHEEASERPRRPVVQQSLKSR